MQAFWSSEEDYNSLAIGKTFFVCFFMLAFLLLLCGEERIKEHPKSCKIFQVLFILEKLILLRAVWHKHLVHLQLIFIFHSLFLLLIHFLRCTVVEKVNNVYTWYMSTYCTTSCSVKLKLPLFAQIFHAIRGAKKKKPTHKIVFHSPAIAKAIVKEVKKTV